MQPDITQITSLFGVLFVGRQTSGRLSLGSLPNNVEQEEANRLREQGIVTLPTELRAFWQWFAPDNAADAASLKQFLSSRWAARGLHMRQARFDPQENRATLDNVIELTHCWLDIDVKYLVEAYSVAEGRDIALPDLIDTAIEKLQGWTMPPAAIVRSGGGIHAYWPLRRAAVTDGELDVAEECNVSLARVWGGDSGAGRRNHSLRLPGTPNRNYTPPRMAALVQCAPLAYDLSALSDCAINTPPLFGLGALVPVEERELADAMIDASRSVGCRLNKGGRAKTAEEWGVTVAKLGVPGQRHQAAMSVAGSLVRKGFARADIVNALVKHGCTLSLPEIHDIVGYVAARDE